MTQLFLECTPIQRQIVAMVTRGDANVKIAAQLCIPEWQVAQQLTNFRLANKLTTPEQVGALAVRAGIA